MFSRLLHGTGFVVALLCTVVAHAHDPMSSWAALQPEANGLHFTFSITEPEANVYVRNVEPSAKIAPDASFETIQPVLLKHAADFFEIRAGGARLVPVESQVVFTDEQTIEVRLVFAWPDGGADSLQFRAAFLQFVSPDHTTFLNVLDLDQHLIAGVMPTVDDPFVVSPMPPRPKQKAPAARSTSGSPRGAGFQTCLCGENGKAV